MRKPARKSTKARDAANRNIGAEIIGALEDAVAFERGEATGATFKAAPISARKAMITPAPEFSPVEIVSIRRTLGLSQALFAQALNISAETEKAWEQGKAPPSGASKRLVEIAKHHPDVIVGRVVSRDDERVLASRTKDLVVPERRSGTDRRSSRSRR
jgi:DNA-binding transcriptional regulator YiaG